MAKIKVGDQVYLKMEECYKWRRIWTVTHIQSDGIHYLKRTTKRKSAVFHFVESAKANELVLKEH